MDREQDAQRRGQEHVAEALRAAAGTLDAFGLPMPDIEGKLLRPAVAWAVLPPSIRDSVDETFWLGGLAIQMVHEASLLHDDILDEAETRRGRETLFASRGVGPALVLGDHYLTAAYRVAAATGDMEFLRIFIDAVERTVAGETHQARCAGRLVSPEEYESVIRGKSGALFGAAMAISAGQMAETAGNAGPSRAEVVEFGVRLGSLYQRLDDFLDYCPNLRSGKPPLQDYRQQKTTFVLHVAGIDGFDLNEAELHDRLFGGSSAPMKAALGGLREDAEALLARQAQLFPGADDELRGILDGWLQMAADALEVELGAVARSGVALQSETGQLPAGLAHSHPASNRASAWGMPALPSAGEILGEVAAAARAVGGPGEWPGYFGRNSRSFRFASRLFPAVRRRQIEQVYAFCRFTDDLVDEATVPVEHARLRLEAWRTLSRRAFEGDRTDIPLLDVTMRSMADLGVPFAYADDLITGVGMDLDPVQIRTMVELKVYTWHVASVVGGWITELFGIRDERLLSRAHALGHAMQITNILRDVGEDWRNGERRYIPAEMLERFGIPVEDFGALVESGTPTPEWVALVEELMTEADSAYAQAFEAIRQLPRFYGRPVAVAARVYQGIQAEIRGNGYDNFSRRAWTTLPTKLRLGFDGLRSLRQTPQAAPSLQLASQDA